MHDHIGYNRGTKEKDCVASHFGPRHPSRGAIGS